jgi:hypothetical protein
MDQLPPFIKDVLGERNWELILQDPDYQHMIAYHEKYGDVIFKVLVDLISTKFSWSVKGILTEFGIYRDTHQMGAVLS